MRVVFRSFDFLHGFSPIFAAQPARWGFRPARHQSPRPQRHCGAILGAPWLSLRYSITSSARARIVCGMVRPSVFAVFRLITSSNRVGCWTGRSAGLAPLRIFPV